MFGFGVPSCVKVVQFAPNGCSFASSCFRYGLIRGKKWLVREELEGGFSVNAIMGTIYDC